MGVLKLPIPWGWQLEFNLGVTVYGLVMEDFEYLGIKGLSDELGYLSRYSNRLWAGRPVFDSRQGQEICLFSTVSGLSLGPTQPPVQWTPGALPLG
jgi:hypothetical protein